MNAYHTVDIKPNITFKLIKENWDIICLERLSVATNIEKSAEIAILLMQMGSAQLYLISDSLTQPIGIIREIY